MDEVWFNATKARKANLAKPIRQSRLDKASVVPVETCDHTTIAHTLLNFNIAMKDSRIVADGAPLEVMQPPALERVFDLETHLTLAGDRLVAVPVP